jgi:hypothetical protein
MFGFAKNALQAAVMTRGLKPFLLAHPLVDRRPADRPDLCFDRRCGAFDLRFERGVSYYREANAEAAWDTFSTGYGPTKTLAANLDAERREALRREFNAFHAGFATELGICVPREYWLAVGVRK